jgi:hypothetical protein
MYWLDSRARSEQPDANFSVQGSLNFQIRFRKYKAVNNLGPIAQSVEQRTFNPWVDGSNPSGPTSSDR